jgi:hypothetical protein
MGFYSIIAKFDDLDNHYLVDVIQTSKDPTAGALRKIVAMEGYTVVYVGYDPYHKLDFELLNKFKSKLNDKFYRIDLPKVLGIVGYQNNKHLYVDNDDTNEQLRIGLGGEYARRERNRDWKKIPNDFLPTILTEYEKLEKTWVEYWTICQHTIEDFYKKYPKPKLSDYESNILFIKTSNEEKFRKAEYEHLLRYEHLARQLAVSSKTISNVFQCNCPGSCNKKVSFRVEGFMSGDEDWYAFEPIKIYCWKRIKHFISECADCGPYAFEWDNKNERHYTCVASSEFSEYIDVLEFKFRYSKSIFET